MRHRKGIHRGGEGGEERIGKEELGDGETIFRICYMRKGPIFNKEK